MIDVTMTAWPNHPKRIEYFHAVVKAFREKLCATRHTLRWLCSAESERDPQSTWHGDELEALCAQYGIALTWRDGPASLGANMNAALRLCTAPSIFLVQDDWLLLEPLDLSPGAEFMAAHPEVALLRYSWPGDLPTFVPHADGWRRFALDGQWPYGDDPHLRRPDFMQRYGWYLEGGNHGVSEGNLLWRLRDARAEIAAADRCYFATIGDVASVPRDKERRKRSAQR